MSVTMDKLAKELKKQISASDDRKPKAYDTQAEVLRVEDGTAWVHIPGGVTETPVRMTINAKKGDMVNVHIADGTAWITGNGTNPPTDDSTANYAIDISNSVKKDVTILNTVVADEIEATHARFGDIEADTAKIHDLTADQLTATVGYIDDLTAADISASDISADHATVGELEADHVSVSDLNAVNGEITNLKSSKADISVLESEYAHITNGTIDNAKIGYADVNGLNANYAHITEGVIDNAKIGHADVNGLNANYANIHATNIDTATIQNEWVNKILVQTGLLAYSSQIYTLDAIEVNAANITAGTLDVNRLIVTVGEGSSAQKYLVNIDPSTGTPSYEKLDGNIVKPRTITADKIVAGAITTNEITANNLQGTSGWINLHEGKFFYGDGASFASATNAISWNGSKLQIKADEFLLSSGKTIQEEIEAVENWFYSVPPTTSNEPAKNWTTTNLKEQHLRDIYFDTTSGKSYRWSKDNNVYSWVEIQDVELAALAKDLHDNYPPTSKFTVAPDKIQSTISEAKAAATDDANTATDNKLKNYSTTTQMNSAIDQKAGEINLSVDEKISDVISVKESSGNIVSIDDASEYPALDLIAHIEPVQSGSGTPSPDNIRPISGHDSVVVTRTGINVWDEEWEVGNIDSGNPTVANDRIRSKNFIPVVGGATYYTTGRICWYEYDADKNFIKVGNSGSFVENQTFTISSNCSYIKFKCTTAYGTTYNNDISINYPSTDTEYHAYAGQIYTTDLGRTVYGGTLDVVSGELVVDRVAVDMGSLNWVYESAISNTHFRAPMTPLNGKYQGELISTMFVQNPKHMLWGNITNGEMCIDNSVATPILRVKDDEYTDATAFKTAVTGQTLVYELATLQTYQLTAQQVDLLLGINNVWNDTGDTYLKYVTMNSDMLSLMDKSNADLERAKAEIKITTDGITSEVSKKVGSSEIISKINQSAETVKIEASKVEIDGTTTFNAIKASADAAYDAKGSASAVQTNLDNLEVGGRNYCAEVAAFVGGSASGITYTYKGDGVWNISGTATAANARGTYAIIDHFPALGYGDTFTLSVDDSMPSGMYLYVNFADSLSTTSQKIIYGDYGASSFTFTCESNYRIRYIGLGFLKNAAVNVNLRMKLEKGNKATDWTPAPEDVQAEIDKRNVHTLLSASTTGQPYATLLGWAKEGALTMYTINTASTPITNVKIGNSVRLGYPVSNMGTEGNRPLVYINGTVTAIPDATHVTLTAHGLDTTIIDGGDIITNSVGANQIAANAITSDELAANSVIAGKIATGAVTADKIAANTITIGKIASDTQSQILNSEIEVGGRNYCADIVAQAISSVSGITYTYKGDGVWNISGTSTADNARGTYLILDHFPSLGYGDTFTLSLDDTYDSMPSNMRFYVNFANSSSTDAQLTIYGDWGANTFTFTSASNYRIRYLGLGFKNGATFNVNLRMKLENGNKATAWTPAPEDTLNSAVNVDARNYWLALDRSKRTCGSNAVNCSYDGEGTYVLTCFATSPSAYAQIYTSQWIDAPDLAGKTAIFHADSITTTNSSADERVYVAMQNASGVGLGSHFLNASNLSRVITFPATLAKIQLIIRMDQNKAHAVGDVMTVVKPKLEIGHQATGWTQAPEDIELDIADSAKTATTYITAIDNNGIQVHAANNPTSNYAKINADGMEVYKGGTRVAKYGDTSQVGPDSKGRVEIAPSGMDIYGYNSSSNAAFNLSHIGCASGTSGDKADPDASGSSGTAVAPYYTFGTRASGTIGNYSFSSGTSNLASGPKSHAEGQNVTASGNMSHAEGANTVASSYEAHAEGYKSTASGAFSHAEGRETTASGVASHAEGYKSTASGYSHAEGQETTASGSGAHAEGYKTKATAAYAHAEGYSTTASGQYSHAEGNNTTASGNGSHASGYSTKAAHDYQTVVGKFNKVTVGEETDAQPYFVVGGGNSDSERANLLSVGINGINSSRHVNYLYVDEGIQMINGQVITLSQKISDQLTGIVIVWSAYKNGAAQNYGWDYQFIPKHHAIYANGEGCSHVMSTDNINSATICKKYVYVYDDKIGGNAANDDTGTGFANNAKVLRAVWGI